MAQTPLPLTMSGCIEMLGLRCLIAPKCRPESVSRHMAGISQAAAPFHLPPSNGGRDTLSTTTLSTTTLPHCLTVHPTLQGLQTPGNRSHGPADWHVREVRGGAAASDYTDLTLALEDETVFPEIMQSKDGTVTARGHMRLLHSQSITFSFMQWSHESESPSQKHYGAPEVDELLKGTKLHSKEPPRNHSRR